MTAVVWGGKTGAGLDVGCGEGDGGQRMASGFLVEGKASRAVRTQEPVLGEGHGHRGSTSGLSHPQLLVPSLVCPLPLPCPFQMQNSSSDLDKVSRPPLVSSFRNKEERSPREGVGFPRTTQ